jgi:methionine-gamma-lyase
LRGALGTQLDPNTAWMIMRSMETLAIRMERAAQNAKEIAAWLATHPKIASVNYHGLLPMDDPRRALAERQSTSPGSTFSFYVQGGEAEAFRLLDNLQVMKLAVSLGGTETLISHPGSTTHSGVQKEVRERMGVSDSMVRISVGIEHVDDLIADLSQALSSV